MSFRAWISVITFVLLGAIIAISWDEIVQAWRLLERVNIWILLLLIPGQILVYHAAGEMVFAYLRSKKSIHHLNVPTLGRMALEMNFVNHILPSGGVSGISYMTWRLKHYGVSASRATMAQVVRFAAGFMAFITLLLISVVVVTIDDGVNRWVILLSALLIGLLTTAIGFAIFLLSSQTRMTRFSGWLYRVINSVVRRVTFGKKKNVVKRQSIEKFFEELHEDYMSLSKDKKMLIKPYIWGLVFTAGDALLFMITFWALGVPVNPAVILIAYGLAATAGFFVITPGGTGAYEAIMVAFLAIAGVASSTAIAGILLTRIILLFGTILFGYIFYQHAILHHGKAGLPDLHR